MLTLRWPRGRRGAFPYPRGVADSRGALGHTPCARGAPGGAGGAGGLLCCRDRRARPSSASATHSAAARGAELRSRVSQTPVSPLSAAAALPASPSVCPERRSSAVGRHVPDARPAALGHPVDLALRSCLGLGPGPECPSMGSWPFPPAGAPEKCLFMAPCVWSPASAGHGLGECWGTSFRGVDVGSAVYRAALCVRPTPALAQHKSWGPTATL